MKGLRQKLESEAAKRNCDTEVCDTRPDPILIAREYNDPVISLVCALFSYGNVPAILKLLRTLDFSLLQADEAVIKKELRTQYYRFQKSDDIINLFITLRRLNLEADLQSLFLHGYQKEYNVLDGIAALILAMERVNPYDSKGYRFLISHAPDKRKTAGSSPLKRWNMYLRWMVRSDCIDLGLWEGVRKKDLILPLDTHTFNVAGRLGLIRRKSYDLKAALELTESLKKFDPEDPVKYDFALYRLGQEKIIR